MEIYFWIVFGVGATQSTRKRNNKKNKYFGNCLICWAVYEWNNAGAHLLFNTKTNASRFGWASVCKWRKSEKANNSFSFIGQSIYFYRELNESIELIICLQTKNNKLRTPKTSIFIEYQNGTGSISSTQYQQICNCLAFIYILAGDVCLWFFSLFNWKHIFHEKGK